MPAVLVIRFSSLGDVLFALAAVERLKSAQPQTRIAFLTEDRFEAIPRAHRDVDEVLVFPRRSGAGAIAKHLASLRSLRFDAVLDLQGNAKSALPLLALRRSRRIGFARGAGRDGAFLLLDERVTPPPTARHRVDRFLSLLAPLGVLAHRERPAPLVTTDAQKAEADRIAREAEGRPLVVLHPGTSPFGTFKRWEPERYGRLARRLADERGAVCRVSGGPGEKELTDAAVAASNGAAKPLGPLPTLLDLAAVLARADLLVAADTGPLHLANRMGTPVVALFGPKDPAIYGPVYEPARVIRRIDVPCSPCTRRWCEAPACMAAIGVDPVMEAASELLALPQARTRRFTGC